MGGHYKAVEVLLVNEAEVNLVGTYGSKLAAAVENGHGGGVGSLLARGSNLLPAVGPGARWEESCE